MNEPYEYLKDRVNCLWINFDSYDFQNIIEYIKKIER